MICTFAWVEVNVNVKGSYGRGINEVLCLLGKVITGPVNGSDKVVSPANS